MLIKYIPKLYERLGTLRFTLVYGVFYSFSVNLISISFIRFVLGEHFSIVKILVYSIVQFIVGVFLARHVIKRVKSGEI
jgi:hypothetical protein